MKSVAFTILFAIATQSAAGAKLPSFITPCSPSNDECLKHALEQLEPHLLDGIPEFQLPSLEPISIPDYIEKNVYTPEMSFNTSVTEIQYYGTTNFTVSKFHVNIDDPKLDLVLTFPQITFDLLESFSAKAFGWKVNVTRPGKFALTDVVVTVSINGTKKSKEGELYIKWNDNIPKLTFNEGHHLLDPTLEARDGFDQFLKKLFGKSDLYKPTIWRYLENSVGEFIVHALNIVHDIYPVNVLYVTH